jgi:hypothetical protein
MLKKIFLLLIVSSVFYAVKFVMFDYEISNGKRVGNLTKVSKKGKFIQTWELTIDEGVGDKLTTFLSVKDDDLAEELFQFEGKEVILFYSEHFMGWPRDTKYVVTSWKPQEEKVEIKNSPNNDKLMGMLEKTMFCSFLGSLRKNSELYEQVKQFMKQDNLYLYKQYQLCNE